MNCPHCGKPIDSDNYMRGFLDGQKGTINAVKLAISPTLAAKALRSIKSESRAKASKENGKLGGAPRQVRCRICGMTERKCKHNAVQWHTFTRE